MNYPIELINRVHRVEADIDSIAKKTDQGTFQAFAVLQDHGQDSDNLIVINLGIPFHLYRFWPTIV